MDDAPHFWRSPTGRVGWIAFTPRPWRQRGPYQNVDDAARVAQNLGADARISYGTTVGYDFIPMKEPGGIDAMPWDRPGDELAVLWVDPTEESRAIYETLLDLLGPNIVRSVDNAALAFDTACAWRFNMIVIDEAADQNFSLAIAMRDAQCPSHGARIVRVSAVRRHGHSSIDAVIGKPVTARALRNQVRALPACRGW